MRKVISLVFCLASITFAFWPAGGVKVVQTPDAISNPQMVYIEDGSVIISWEADRHIYCQKLDTTGVIHWSAEGVRVCLSDSTQLDHHMVSDGQDVWFVWQDERTDDGDIYTQKINGSSGQRLWDDQGKGVCVKTGRQDYPNAVIHHSGDFITTWTDLEIEPYNAMAQWFDSVGLPIWEEDGIYVGRDFSEAGLSEVYPSGSAVLNVWVGIKNTESEYGYYSQRIDADGNFLWDTLGVLIEYMSANYDKCGDGMGGAIVLFGNPGYLGIQRIDSTGDVVWDSGGINITEFVQRITKLTQLPYPDPDWNGIISDGSGGCFVWSGFDVHHAISNGNLIWGSAGIQYWIDDGITYRLSASRMCPDGNDGLMVVFDNLEWTSTEWPPYIDQGLRVQRVNAAGEVVFDTNGIIIRLWNPDSLPYGELKTGATVVPGGVIVSWSDNRHQPDYSLYAQIVDTTGKVGSGIEEDIQSITYPDLEVISCIFSENVMLKYSLPAEGSATLKFYEMAGRLIQSQTLKKREGVITINTQDLPSGVYYVQLSTLTNKRISRKVLVIH